MALLEQHRKLIKNAIIESGMFDCKDLDKFTNTIIEELPWSGYSGSKFYGCGVDIYEKNKRKYHAWFTVKIAFYNKSLNEIYLNESKYMPMTDCEIKILEILTKEFLLYPNNISPCITELISYKKCNNISKLIPSDQYCFRNFDSNYAKLYSNQPTNSLKTTLCNQNISINKNMAHNSMAFIALQRADFTLKELLESYIEFDYNFQLMKSMLFMIIHAFYRIKKTYPLFHHGDLHINNVVFLSDIKFTNDQHKYFIFYANSKKYYVPYNGILPKIIDFGFSSLPEKGIVNAIEGDVRKTSFPQDNDICYLFNKINSVLNVKKHPKLIQLLSDIDLKETFKRYNREYLKNHTDKITSIEDMINSSVWDLYRDNKPDKSQIIYEWKK